MFDPNKKEAGIAPLIVIGLLAVAALVGGYTTYQFTNWFSDVGLWMVDKTMGIMLALVNMFFGMSMSMFEAIGSWEVMKTPITRGAGADAQAVMHGWAIVRDFSNMLIVLGFVIVGIATILRIREYEAQKTLVPLIIVALLINFSLLICGIIIDATNITANYFTRVSGPAGVTVPIKNILQNPDLMNKITESIGGPPLTKDNFMPWVSAMASITLFTGIAGMIFFMYGVLLLFRRVALMCLVILAPLAFVCYVFPATKPIFNKWWSQFTQWAIITIPASFFIYLAGHMLQGYLGSGGDINLTGANLAFWIPTAFLFFAYSLIFQASAIGSAAAIGLVTGAAGFAMGASKKVGGFAAGATGASRAGQKVKDWGTRLGEYAGVVSKGTLANRQAARQTEAKKRIDLLGLAEKTRLANSAAYTAEQRDNKAAAIQSLIASGDSNRLTDRERASAYVLAQGGGAKISDLAKQDYRFAQYDNRRVQTYMRQHPGTNEADAQREIMRQQLETNWSGMSRGDKRNTDLAHIDANFVERTMSRSDISNYRIAHPNTINHLQTTIRPQLEARRMAYADTIPDPNNPGQRIANPNANAREHGRIQGLVEEIDRL